MLVLVTYDVNTETAAGKRRLRRIAKVCSQQWAARAELGVRACWMRLQYVAFKARLAAIIDPEHDSLRLYQLGNSYKDKVEHIGRAPEWGQDDILIL